jgi:hypothetical protein
MIERMDTELRVRTFVPPLSPEGQRRAAIVVPAMLGLLCGYLLLVEGTTDWLLISGSVALVVGLILTHALPARMDHMLGRLAHRGVLAVPVDQLWPLGQELERHVVRFWAPLLGGIVAVSIGAAFVGAFSWQELTARYPLLLVEMAGGYIAGCYLGRMACYGGLRAVLKARGIGVRLVVGHLDAVGGLKPIGDFYFLQAMIVGIPAVFLAVWLLLIPLPAFEARYQNWREPYLCLLVLAIAIEALAFLVPLWSFHGDMVRQKRELLQEADRLSPRMAEIQAQLAEGAAGSEKQALRETLADMTARYRAIEELPVWPVDVRTRRFFGLNNAALLVPVLAEQIGLTDTWARLAQQILTSA